MSQPSQQGGEGASEGKYLLNGVKEGSSLSSTSGPWVCSEIPLGEAQPGYLSSAARPLFTGSVAGYTSMKPPDWVRKKDLEIVG